MSFQIRAFRSEDYDAITAVYNEVYSEYPTTADQIRFNDNKRDPKCKFARYVVEQDGKIIAVGIYDQRVWNFHPKHFEIELVVPKELRTEDLTNSIFSFIVSEIQQFQPKKLSAYFREDYERFKAFFESRGFVKTIENWESRLDVQSFDFAPYRDWMKELEHGNIIYKPLSEIPESEERNHALHDLDNALGEDVPSEDPYTPVSYEYYVERSLKNPDLYADGYYLALDGDKFVGVSALWTSQANDDLYTGLTGVRREYRRRGIALALKLKTIEVAQKAGYRLIKTWNESNNKGMLEINNRLGFVRQPAWLGYSKEL